MAEASSGTSSRKAEHLRINLEEDVRSGVDPGFDAWRFVPLALPELNLAEVDPAASFLGHSLRAPLLISCMTGGTPEAGAVNRVLARVAQSQGLALGLGSGRALLEDPGTLDSFDVRDLLPSYPLLANLGAVQLLRGVDAGACARLVDMLHADALVLHLNALQEALQEGGDVDFRGLLDAIAGVCAQSKVPVVVKEVGWGIPPDDVKRLFDAGVTAVDVAGAGGTSWSAVEGLRGTRAAGRLAAAFRDWGLPTAAAVRRAREAAPAGVLIASGGVTHGVDVAKAIALGADLVGIAGPFLRAAARGEEAATDLAEDLVGALRLAMFCIGAPTVAALRVTSRLEPAVA